MMFGKTLTFLKKFTRISILIKTNKVLFEDQITLNIVSIQVRKLNLLEHISYQLLQEYGIATPKFGVAHSKEEAKKIFQGMKTKDCVVKAQVLSGGRQKGHFKKGLKSGVQVASSADEVYKLAEGMIGDVLITKQTGASGLPCNKIMITERKLPKKEYYFSIMMDRSFNGPAIICSSQGGTSIEEVAAKNPKAIIMEPIDIVEGLKKDHAKKIVQKVGISGKGADLTVEVLLKLYKMFIEKDALLLEMNPYVEDSEGNYFCLDAKFRFDDSAKFRQKKLFALHDPTQEKKSELEASERNLNYIQLDGDIGCMVNGAGLAMATMDIIKLFEGDPANFLDVGGAATPETIQFALQTIVNDKRVIVIFVNIFGGIMRCDMIAQGLVTSMKNINLQVPIVCRLLGTRNKEAKAIINQSKLNLIMKDDFSEAAQAASKLSLKLKKKKK